MDIPLLRLQPEFRLGIWKNFLTSEGPPLEGWVKYPDVEEGLSPLL